MMLRSFKPGRISRCDYAYDDFNRLATASAPGQAYTYAYDRFGNRWQQNGPHTVMLGFTGNNNRMDGYAYDAAGNVLNDGATAFTYDAENRIITAVNSSSGTSTYLYNANDQRIRKTTVASGTVDYLYDLAGRSITEVTASGAFNRGEVYAGGRHLVTFRGGGISGTTYFIHADWLGTERARTTATGASFETCTSLPFGDWLTCSGSDPSPMHFTGKERDSESGLDEFGARYYSSPLGRFTIPDWAAKPIAVPYAEFGSPQSLNLYTYVGNSPLNHADVDGHCWPFCGAMSWVTTHIAIDGGPNQFAKNLGLGVAKGAGSFVYNTVNTAVMASKGPGAAAAAFISNAVTPGPKALAPSNETQGQVSTATQVALSVASVLAPGMIGGASAEVATTTVTHFTDNATVDLISGSGQLNAGSFVTLPSEIPAGATSTQVESLLEIGPGKGANSITFDTPTSNLVVPPNGSTTSGGATQFTLQEPARIDPSMSWVKRPPNPK